MIFCLSTFIIIPLLVDLFEQEYYTKCFVIVFLFILSVKGLCKNRAKILIVHLNKYRRNVN